MRSEATSRARAEGIAHMPFAAARHLLGHLVPLISANVASSFCYDKVLASTLDNVSNRKLWKHVERFGQTIRGRNTKNPSTEDRISKP